MKITIEYVIPEEEEEFRMTKDGAKYQSILFEFDQHLREIIRREDPPEDDLVIYETLRDKLRGFCDEQGVDIW